MAPDPVAEDAGAVAVWPAAQDAAVGRFVTPAGTQMLSAYLIVAVVKCEQYSWIHSVLLTSVATHHLGRSGCRLWRRSMLLP